MYAIDISAWQGRPPAAWFEAAGQRFDLAIVQAWGGLPGFFNMGPNPHAEYQLRGFREAGLQTAAYIWLPPDHSTTATSALVASAVKAMGAEVGHLVAIAPDLEGGQIHPTDPQARLASLISEIRAQTSVTITPIYCRANNWEVVMGGPCTAFAEHPLWEARYVLNSGMVPNVAPPLEWRWTPFGGWRKRAMLQYAGTAPFNGVGADWNVYSPDGLGIEPPAAGTTPDAGPPPADAGGGLTVGQYEELKNKIDHEARLALERINGVGAAVGELERRIAALEARLAPPPAPPPAPSGRTHTVKRGESLSEIAAKFGIAPWQVLYDANRDIIGPDPNLIRPGQVLRIP